MSGDTVPITQLPISQLVEIAKQYKQKVEFLTTSIKQLKLLQNQFSSSNECLKTFIPNNMSKEILVPLTSTLSIPGNLTDVETVLIDIGTGYFVDMSIDQASSHFKRRMDHIEKQVDKIAPLLEQSIQIHKSVLSVLDAKDAEESKTAPVSK